MKKVNAYRSVNSNGNVANPSTANKTSCTKSNASESTTLKKVVPAHMVKPVVRQPSQEGHSISQNSTNQKLFQRVKSSKAEKSQTVGNLTTVQGSSSGNKLS